MAKTAAAAVALAIVTTGCQTSSPAAAPLPAFPGAEGAGAYASGGRGGRAIQVTNLDDSGPGSLRAAIESEGPRTVVFTLSGTIQLRSPLAINNGNITIAGQSAPGDGITLRDYPLVVDADNVVIRYLRSRLGDESGVQDDAIWVRGGRGIILDHVSASWSVDETLSVSERYERERGGPFDVTVQWSIMGESLNRSAHDKGRHGFGSLVRGGRGSRFSFHHNLWASHLARMPRPGNYTDRWKDPVGAYFDFRNNVFYNWGGDASGYNADKDSLATYNFIGNAYVTGPDSRGAIAFKEQNPHALSYFADNAMDGVLPASPWTLVTGIESASQRLTAPHPMPAVKTEQWDSAFKRVLETAGASAARDTVDVRIVEGVRSRRHQLIDTQEDVGGWPQLWSAPPPRDSDADGMPDAWETARGLNPSEAADGSRSGSEGYTNLEIYLNTLIR